MDLLEKQLTDINEHLIQLIGYQKMDEENWRRHLGEQESGRAKNEIENKEDESVELDDSMRIPIVDGVKFKYEGEPDERATQVKIYGSKTK